MSNSTKTNTTTDVKPGTEEQLALPKSKLGLPRAKLGGSASPIAIARPLHLNHFKGAVKKTIQAYGDGYTGYALLKSSDDSYIEQLYLIPDEETAEELSMLDAKVRIGQFVIYQTMNGRFGVDFISDSDDPWTTTRMDGMTKAVNSWVMIRNIRNGIEGYTVKEFPSSAAPAKWPDDIDALFLEIMEGHIITSMDHPVARKISAELFGEVAESTHTHSAYVADGILDDDED